MIPLTQNTLEKLENLFSALGYKVRYEKGNFKTGSCLLQDSKIIVVNRFSSIDVKVNSLMDLLKELNPNGKNLNEKQQQLVHTIKQTKLTL